MAQTNNQKSADNVFVYEVKAFSASELKASIAHWLTSVDAVDYQVIVTEDALKPYLVVAKIPGVYTDGGA